MKRKIALILTLLFLCSFFAAGSASVSAAPLYCDAFYGSGKAIQSLAYDGTTFVGVLANKLIYSSDFEQWTALHDLPDVAFVVRLGDRFVAVGHDTVLHSADGRDYTASPLPQGTAEVSDYLCAGGRLLVDFGAAGCYSTADGKSWSRLAEGVGAPFFYLNRRLFLSSRDGSSSLYASDDGVHAYLVTDKLPGGHLTYYGGEFHTCALISAGQSEQLTLYSTSDFSSWRTEVHPADYLYPRDAVVISLPDGREVAYSAQGRRSCYQHGVWLPDDIFQLPATSSCYSYYQTDAGLFCSSPTFLVYLPDGETVEKTADRGMTALFRLFYDEGQFLAEVNHGSPNRRFLCSKDGVNWSISDYAGRYSGLPAGGENPRILSGNSGTATLTADELVRMTPTDWLQYPLTATLSYPDGSAFRVAYELPTSGDYLTVYGDDGLFYLDEQAGNGTAYLSPDGVTRFPCEEGVLGNGLFISPLTDGRLKIISAAQLRQQLSTDAPRIRLNGEFLSFSISPVIEQGVTYMRPPFLFSRAGAEITWVEEYTAVISYRGHTVTFSLDSAALEVDGIEVPMATPVKLFDGYLMVPLRPILEQLGFTVTYDTATQIVDVTG